MSLVSSRTQREAGVAGAEKERERAQQMGMGRGRGEAGYGFTCYFRSWLLL